MIVLTVVFHNNQPVNATILQQDGTSILFWFPIKMPHYKFLFNGTFYSNYANETTLADINSFLLKNYAEEEIIIFHKKVSQWLDPELKQKLVKLPLEPICAPAHYNMPYHACMTCSYCLASSYAKNYLRYSEGLPVPQQEENDRFAEAYEFSNIAKNVEIPKPLSRNIPILLMNESMKRTSRNNEPFYRRKEGPPHYARNSEPFYRRKEGPPQYGKTRRYKPYARNEDLRLKFNIKRSHGTESYSNNSGHELEKSKENEFGCTSKKIEPWWQRPVGHTQSNSSFLDGEKSKENENSWYNKIENSVRDAETKSPEPVDIKFHYDSDLFDLTDISDALLEV